MTRRDDLVRLVAERRDNAHRAGKEGTGMHRNAGDCGRVAALYAEAKRDLAALIAQGDALTKKDEADAE
jgi:hypothetical protein